MDGGFFLDIAVIAVVLISVVIAVLRGFIREVLTILGLAGGAAAAWVLGPLLVGTTRGWLGVTDANPEEPQQMLMGMVPYSVLAEILAYGLVFITFVIIFSIISYFLSKFVKSIGLGAVDRALGAVFGLARAALVLGLLYLPFYYMVEDEEQKEEWFGNSKSQVYLEMASGWIDGYIPDSAQQAVQGGVEEATKVSEARKKMEELDILRGENKTADQQSTPKKGYTDEFREGMDELIEKVEETTTPAKKKLNAKPSGKTYNE